MKGVLLVSVQAVRVKGFLMAKTPASLLSFVITHLERLRANLSKTTLASIALMLHCF